MTFARETIVGCILAGGLSRRMGGNDKALIRLGPLPMIAHVAQRLRPQVSDLVINTNGDPDLYRDFSLPIVKDSIAGFAGPLAGIAAGMDWALQQRSHATHLATAAADTPFFPADLVARLSHRTGGDASCIVLASSRSHRHPVFGLWPLCLHRDLAGWMDSTDSYKVMAWVERHPWRIVEFHDIEAHPNGIDPFFNANTPQELAEAETLLATIKSGSGDNG
ncbi:molybdenum cofactor guanylyltransferase MobA [Hoeflea sp. CAU 1731]